MLARGIALFILGMATGAYAQTVTDNSGAEIPGPLLSKVISKVTDRMRDPESSRFRRITRGSSDKLKAICGEINAKNAMGGFVGYVGFIYFLDTGEANVYSQSFDDASVKAEQDADFREAGCPIR